METSKPDLSSVCKIEIVEQRGFKAVVLRLKCEGYPDTYYADAWLELVALVRESSPAIESNGEISHFLIFDVAQVKVFSDQFIGLLFKPLMGKDRKTHAPYTPSVALIHCTDSIRQIIELCRLHHILPCYADLHAAIDAMTPQGFSHAIAGIAEMKARQAKRDAERAAQQSLHSSPAVGSSKM